MRCPHCGSSDIDVDGSILFCRNCGAEWSQKPPAKEPAMYEQNGVAEGNRAKEGEGAI